MWTAVAKHLLRSKVHLCSSSHVSRNVLRNKAIPCGFQLQISRRQHSAPAYDQAAHAAAMIQHIEVLDADRFVCVHWKDGGQSLYPYVWLRDNCQCPKCCLRSANARKLPFEDLDVNTGLDKVNLYNGKKVFITWPDEHQSEFDAEWLKKRCFSKKAQEELQEELFLKEHEYWGSNLEILTLPYEDVLCCDQTAYKWLYTLRKVGIVVLEGAPVRQGELVTLGKRIGYMKHTFYGHTWQVQDKVDANNVAYTSGKLSLHTDYPALQYPPGIQFLHCLKQSETGGESEVVDGFHVCNKLKEQNPDAFRILTSTKIDYRDTGVDYCDFSLQSKQQIIELDQNGDLLRIHFNNATRDSVLNIPVEKVQPFYSSLKEFVNLLNRPENVFCFKMKPGQVVTFDNWRILHGRRSYQSGADVSRHLEGSYLDWDVVMSRLRALKTKLQTSK